MAVLWSSAAISELRADWLEEEHEFSYSEASLRVALDGILAIINNQILLVCYVLRDFLKVFLITFFVDPGSCDS